MAVSVTFRQMDATDALKSFATDKVDRINRMLNRPSETHVVLSLEKYMHKADVTVQSNGLLMRGEDKSEDMYQSIDRAVDKIERQLRRYKGKLRQHHVKEDAKLRVRLSSIEQPEEVRNASEVPEDHAPPTVIKTQEIQIRPMGVDEAIMQMDLLHNDFLVFQNSTSRDINVIYRRKDGTIGLIEATLPH